MRERVKLAPFAARVDGRGKIVEQGIVELATGEARREDARIDATDSRAQSSADHLAGERVGRPLPQRENRGDSRAGQPLLAIFANVAQKEITKCDAFDVLRHGSLNCCEHPRVILDVRAWRWNLDLP